MDRRRFTILASAALASVATTPRLLARQATPTPAGLLTLTVEVTDSMLVVPEQIPAGLTEITVTNTGTRSDIHWLMASMPPGKTPEEIDEFLSSEDDTDAIKFDDLGFVGAPDWPAPGGSVTGVVNLRPGVYLLVDIFGGRDIARTEVIGDPPAIAEPVSDLTVTLQEMTIDLPESAFTTEPQRWRIDNSGTMPHEVAVLPVDADLTEEQFMGLLSQPDDATPTPGGPSLDYEPVAAIGVLAAGNTSWLDLQLGPGRYVAMCAVPFGTGYPHAMDGMFVFFDVA